MLVASILLGILGVALFIPICMFFLECMLALLPQRPRTRQAVSSSRSPSVAVVMPAHNEAKVIEASLRSLFQGVSCPDRVLVVADNCTDSTPVISERMGCEVVHRHDKARMGKGFALDFGLQYLSRQPPDVIVVLDADCQVEHEAIRQLATEASLTNRPIQGWYQFEVSPVGDQMQAIASLGLCFKNYLRPLGSLQAGMPCQLHGSGMAFPWELLRKVTLANSNLVEDTQLGIDLAVAGAAPQFMPKAKIRTRIPNSAGNFLSQRKRWEHGYLSLIMVQLPRLIGEAFRQRRFDLLWLAFDLTILPLSLLVFAWFATACLASVVYWWTGEFWPLVLLGSSGALLIFAITAGWVFCGRDAIPRIALSRILWYLLKKLRVYGSFIRKREQSWIRTNRDQP